MKKIFPVMMLLFMGLVFSRCNQNNKIEDNNALDNIAFSTIDGFFKKIKIGDSTAMISLLMQNENIDLKDSTTLDLQSKFNLINLYSGPFISDTLITKRLLNSDIGVYCYLAKYQMKFYRFTFVFYNNGEDVKIFRFSFDQAIDRELQESIKLYVN
jgi:hypothetical protein